MVENYQEGMNTAAIVQAFGNKYGQEDAIETREDLIRKYIFASALLKRINSFLDIGYAVEQTFVRNEVENLRKC